MTAGYPKKRSTRAYLGGEKSLLDPEIEREGVEEILEALTEDEKMRMPDRGMPIRHLRAEKGNVIKAISVLKAALKWRQEFDVDNLVDAFMNKEGREYRDLLIRENVPGKMYVRGYDKHGRAFMIMRPALENTRIQEDNMKHLVWNLEKAIACTRKKSMELGATEPLEKINLIIDYEGFTLSHAPPLSTSKFTLDVLQKFYPERMNHIILLNPPFVFKAFWNLVRPFVDPATKEKIVFCKCKKGMEKLHEMVNDVDKLEPALGGCAGEFDSMTYLNLPFNVSFDELILVKRPVLVLKTLGSGSFLARC